MPRRSLAPLVATALVGLLTPAPAVARGWDDDARVARALDAREHVLGALRLTGRDVRIELLPEHTGFSTLFRVSQRARGGAWSPVAVLKLTSGSTYAAGEVATYRLGRALGVLLYPVTLAVALPTRTTRQLRAMIAEARYRSPRKEEFRAALLADLDAHLSARKPVLAAVKEWVTGFQVLRSWHFEGFARRYGLLDALRATAPLPPDRSVTLFSPGRLDGHRGVFQGTLSYRALARSVSNLMLLDAITCQHDRWPGGNLHFRLLSGGPFRIDGNRFVGGPAGLLALDNGASFRSTWSGLRWLKRYVTRFDRNVVRRLRALAARTARSPEQVRAWLGVDPAGFKRFRFALAGTLAYVDGPGTGRFPEAGPQPRGDTGSRRPHARSTVGHVVPSAHGLPRRPQ